MIVFLVGNIAAKNAIVLNAIISRNFKNRGTRQSARSWIKIRRLLVVKLNRMKRKCLNFIKKVVIVKDLIVLKNIVNVIKQMSIVASIANVKNVRIWPSLITVTRIQIKILFKIL